MNKDQRKKHLIEMGSRIRKAQEEHGLNLYKLALLIGISPPALSLIEPAGEICASPLFTR